MSEQPRYTSIPAPQKPIRDAAGKLIGYRVSLMLQSGAVIIEESKDVVVGEEQAAALASGSNEAFSAWVQSQMETHGIVAEANAAMDAALAQ